MAESGSGGTGDRLRHPGIGAGLSTLLALTAGALTNIATTNTTIPIVTSVVVLSVTAVGFEWWRAANGDEQPGSPPGPGPADPGPARRIPWMAPPLDRIIERPQVGDPLVAALTAPPVPAAGAPTLVALHGPGGFGKTRLATWACHHPEIARRYTGGLLWITLGHELQGTELAAKINDITAALSGHRPPLSDPDAAGAELGRVLDEHGPVLLVIDGLWDRGQLHPFRVAGRSCTRLVTTRVPDVLPAGAVRIQVDALPPDQARAMVTEDVGPLPTATADRLVAAGRSCPVLLNAINGGLHRRVEHGQPIEAAAEAVLERLATDGPTALDPLRPTERTGVGPTVEASVVLLDREDQDRWAELGIFPEDIKIPVSVLELLWPDRPVAELCENFVSLGLAADYRLDPPEPRLVLHDLIREYLRWRMGPDERAAVHRRLIDTAAGLLGPGDGDRDHDDPDHDDPGTGTRPWWTLPDDAVHLWRWLPYHLGKAGLSDERAALVCDPRWIEAKTVRRGSVGPALGDLRRVDTPTAAALRDLLERAAPLLGPIDPPGSLGATLASRLHGVEGLEDVLARYRATLGRPRLEPAWPMPDQRDGDPDSLAVSAGILSCVFSPDGSLLALAGDDGATRIWSRSTRQVVHVVRGHTGGIRACAFSPDGSGLATVSLDGVARLWSVTDGTFERVLGRAEGLTCAAFSPDGSRFAAGGTDGRTWIWTVADGAVVHVIDSHQGAVLDCAFSPDGSLLATTGADHAARLWQLAGTATLRAELSGHHAEVNHCDFSPDGTLLATASHDQTARLWRVATGALQAELKGHGTRVYGCAFSPDGELLATTGVGSVRLWTVTDGTLRAAPDGHRAAVGGCAFSPDGQLLATASIDQTVRLWDLADGAGTEIRIGVARGVGGCAFSPDGQLVAATGLDGSVTFRRVADGSVATEAKGPPGYSGACAFSPDSSWLATAHNDGRVHLWPRDGDGESTVFELTDDGITDCAFSPDGTRLAAASHDHTVTLLRPADGTVLAVLRGHTEPVNAVAFSPDGAVLASASDDRTVRVWPVAGGADARVLRGHDDQVNAVAFSPDGAVLATASHDRTVRLWSAADGRELARLIGHTYRARTCAFSPDGTRLASVDSEGTLRIWDLTSGDRHCSCALRVTGRLISLDWHRDGTLLGAAGGAGLYVFRYLD